MSTTITAVPVLPIGAPNVTTGAPTTPADQVVAVAKDLPDLISKASTFDPALAAKFTGQSLAASRTPWGTLAGGIVGWLVAREGLGWDQATCDFVAGACVFLASYAMRYITANPITGIFRKATVAEAVATASPAQAVTP